MNNVHGMRHTPEYMAWSHLKDRCNNANSPDFSHYGGRGIKVCDKWLNSFKSFFEDIGERPSSAYSLERIDVNGDYEPRNCKWATREEQSVNRRAFKNNTSGTTGVCLNKRKTGWVAYINHKKQRIHLGSFKRLDEAIKARKRAEVQYGR